MLTALRQVLNDSPGSLRAQLAGLYGVLILANLGAWILALAAFRHYPLLLGTSLLAYSFGLRHAVDADHIAAIDNVTRKLMQEGRRPIAVGCFFSLGHSSVVIALSVLVACTTAAIQVHFPAWRAVGGGIGTAISALFLLLIAALNLVILRDVFRSFRQVRHGGGAAGETPPLPGGLLGRLLRPLFRLISRSWHMYPLGILFGLGFDTATEVGLLGISASQAAQGLPVWSILIFPALFTAGMALVDTTDGVLMLGAYGWAHVKPIRKLYYNLTITALSVLVALLVGGIEALGLLAGKLHLEGWFWDAIAALEADFASIGFGIIGIFILGWLVSALIYRLKGYDAIEEAAS